MTPSRLNPPQHERNWSDLPSDVMINILKRVGMVDIHENAQKVCTSWYKICKEPVLWKVINMKNLLRSTSNLSSAKVICKHAVDRSQGQLVDITLVYDDNAQLFLYVADRSSQLRRLEMARVLNFRSLTTDALTKFPLLEELNLYLVPISKEEIETVGRCCPMLKTLKVNAKLPKLWVRVSVVEEALMGFDTTAIAIGHNLPELRYLQLIGNTITDIGLQVILDNCHHLETLDLRMCFNVDFKGDLAKNICKQIKHLSLPNYPIYGCPYYYELVSEACDDEDYDPYYESAE